MTYSLCYLLLNHRDPTEWPPSNIGGDRFFQKSGVTSYHTRCVLICDISCDASPVALRVRWDITADRHLRPQLFASVINSSLAMIAEWIDSGPMIKLG